MNQEAIRVIEGLGGANAIAAMCDPPITAEAVYQWKSKGLPPARRQYFKLIRPDLFEGKDSAPTSTSQRGLQS